MSVVIDKNGKEIKIGQTALIHQEEGTRKAIIVETFPDRPTVNKPGHWVDVDIDRQGPEGIPSYIIEVIS